MMYLLPTSTFILSLLPLVLSAPSFPRSDQPQILLENHHHRHPSRDLHSLDHTRRQVKVRRMAEGKKEKKRSCQAASNGAVVIGNEHAAAVPPTTGNTSSGDSIFPVSVKDSWTTVEGRSGALSFDAALKPLTAGKLPPSIAAPDGSTALQASYPANTVKYSSSTGAGFSFYTLGAHNSVDVTTATEVLFTYSVYFSDGFDFVKGGKLPGLYGGESLETAKSCSGGRQDERDTCFSARMMWRTNGMGEMYNYFPESAKQPEGYCSIAPKSVCDPTYGDSIGRGIFSFPTGKWTTVTQRLRLNTPASASNGEQELFVNGQSVLKVQNLQIRVKDDTKIYGIMAQTFFGGSDQSWASPKDQWAWFKDWSLGVVY